MQQKKLPNCPRYSPFPLFLSLFTHSLSHFPPKYIRLSPDYAGDLKCRVLPTNSPHLEQPFPFGWLGKVISLVLSLKLPPALLCMWLGLNESNKTPINLGWNESLLHWLAVWLTHVSFSSSRGFARLMSLLFMFAVRFGAVPVTGILICTGVSPSCFSNPIHCYV